MKFESKYNIGDVVFYPSADVADIKLLQAPILGVIFMEDEKKKVSISYRTELSYGIPEDVASLTFKEGKKILSKLLNKKIKEMTKGFETAIEEFKKMNDEELVTQADSLRVEEPVDDGNEE